MTFPEQYRFLCGHPRWHSSPGDHFGWFCIPGSAVNGRALKAMAVDGEETGWDHVSVSLFDSSKKCPSWDEMCVVKALFWAPGECAVQFHPSEEDYVNRHSGCLHLWRCVNAEFPMPPKICV